MKVLQELLNLLPADIVSGRLEPDGVLGNSTRIAVKQFQAYFDLRADGIVGPETFYHLGHRTGVYATDGPVFSARLLKPDAAGVDVAILQNRLAAFRKGYLNRPASGKYEPATVEAVKKFQQDFSNLSPDGIVGPETYDKTLVWAPLGGRTLRRSRNGLDTYWLQLQLFLLGYYTRPLHGYFDAATEKSLRSFQTDAGLRVDGMAGPQTYLALGACSPFPSSFYYYRVQKGDSIDDIVGLFSKNLEEMIKLNNLEPPGYMLYPGQMLFIPSPLTFHLAQKNETLAQVARKYALSVADVQKANPFIPTSFLLPGEMIVLPRFQQALEGSLAYLQADEGKYDLKTLDLSSTQATAREVFSGLAHPELFMADQCKVSVINQDNDRKITTVDLETGLTKKVGAPPATTHLDWARDGSKIVVNGGMVLEGQTGKEICRFAGGDAPQWFEDNENILHMLPGSQFQIINSATGKSKHLFSLAAENIWSFRLSPDNTWLILLGYVSPDRTTVTYRCHLATRERKEISSHDFAAAWSQSSDKFLLLARDYYGEYFPWFYHHLKLYDLENNTSSQIIAKGLEISQHVFSGDDKWLAVVLYNPVLFYPVITRARDIFIKHSASRLITRVTLGEKAFSPAWL